MRCSLAGARGHDTVCPVRDLLILAIHVLVTFAKLPVPVASAPSSQSLRR